MNVDDPIELIAQGLFSTDAPARKQARAALAARPEGAVAAYFKADKRNVHTIADASKVVKLIAEYEGLGLDGFALAVALLRAQRETAQTHVQGLQFDGALAAALRYPGRETEVFDALSDVEHIYLPSPKNTLWPGLSRLRAMVYLRVPEGTLRASDHIAELAAVPQRFRLSLWVKDVKLALWDAAKHNVSGLDLRGAYSNLSDASPLAGWTALQGLDLGHTGVTDVSPLRGLALEQLHIGETKVVDLRALAAMTTLRNLRLTRLMHADLAPVWGLTGLEHLDLAFTQARDLAPLRAFTRLRTLELWGTSVASFDPLTDLPLEQVGANYSVLPDLAPLAKIKTLRSVSIYGSAPDAPGLAALRRERPEVVINR